MSKYNIYSVNIDLQTYLYNITQRYTYINIYKQRDLMENFVFNSNSR